MKTPALRERFFAAAPRYEDRGFLGRGGSGIVFAAWDRELGQEVAIKVLAPPSGSDEEDWAWRIRREVRSARRVKHPNVAQIYDLAEAGDFSYVTMELVHGRSLAEVLDDGPLTVSRMIPILRQAALGVQAAHDLGIVHRDLKPGNIMVGAEGEVAVLDFGLAIDVKRDVRRTRHGLLPGTPAYMAPEQIHEEPIDGRVDVYALGVIGWEGLTGVSPFVRESPMKTLLAHLNERPPSGALEASGVPPGLASVLLRCLSRDASGRPATAADLARQLAAFSSSRTIATLTAGALERPPRVLVADDEKTIRSLLGLLLGKEGFDVVMAANGEEVLEKVAANPPDAILLDVNMPLLDGIDTLRLLKAGSGTAAIPVIIISAIASRSRQAFAVASGAVDFFAKPLDLPALLSCLRSVTGR